MLMLSGARVVGKVCCYAHKEQRCINNDKFLFAQKVISGSLLHKQQMLRQVANDSDDKEAQNNEEESIGNCNL